ncbi:MAG: hypothetical protein H6813_00705 [Phycisphaeraceae bacterium]|nr:hypothetical protein [Phycisphaeraceae bacterium]MCB9847394.1 hypothetical protein [Phycisphaeraceae bacterium]
MPKRSMIAPMLTCALIGAATTASGAVTFTFQDPSSAREFQYTEGDQFSDGHIAYDAPLSLTVDASDHGLAPVTFDAVLQIDLAVGVASDLGFGSNANVSGTFRFFSVSRGQPDLILEGIVSGGDFLVLSSTGAQVSSSSNGSLALNAGPVLQGYLDGAGLALAGQMDSAFSLSSIRLGGGIAGVPGINEFGYCESFNANAAYVGSAEVIPAPPPALLTFSAIGLTARRRNRWRMDL